MNEHDTDLTPGEREALRALGGPQAPPADLEGHVLAELAARGSLGRRSRRAPAPVLLAAGLALFAAGLAAGRLAPRSAPAEPSPRYLLLLERDTEPLSPAETARRVAEYSAWAGDLRRAGKLVTAEKLASRETSFERDPSGALVTAASGRPTLGGFFLVTAHDEAEALRLARACPHLKYGGRVVVRPVEEVPRRG